MTNQGRDVTARHRLYIILPSFPAFLKQFSLTAPSYVLFVPQNMACNDLVTQKYGLNPWDPDQRAQSIGLAT